MTNRIKIIGYCRASTQDQTTTLLDQAERLRAYCRAFPNYDLTDVVTANESAKDVEHREDFKRVLSRLYAGEASALLIFKLDRFARDLQSGLAIAQELERRKITLISICDYIDMSTAQGRFLFSLQLSMAALERETTAERTSRALQWKMKNGERVSSILPYGQMECPDDRTKTLPCPREIAVINRMRRLYEDGQTFSGIARILNREEVPTKLGKVGKWSHKTISRILERSA